MGFPTASSDSLAIVGYGAEVSGRLRGCSELESLVPDAERRAVLRTTGETVATAARGLLVLYVERVTLETFERRGEKGRGRAYDRGFDRLVAHVAENVRTGPGGGSRDSREFRAVFPEGTTDPFQRPTIREDPELCSELERRLAGVAAFPQKDALVAATHALGTLLGPVATGLSASEQALDQLFAREVVARQGVIDALWVGKRAVEQQFFRDRSIVSFAFFPFRERSSAASDEDEPAPPAAPTSPTPE